MEVKTITSQELIALIQNMTFEEQYLFFKGAAELSNLKLCQICLDAGLDINMQESMYKQPLLVSLMSTPGTLTLDVVAWFIEHGYDINLASAAGYTPLKYACYHGNYTFAKYFIENGAKIQSGPNVQFFSDLHDAVSACETHEEGIKVVRLLLDSGAPLEDTDNTSRNPFMRALKTKKHDVVELFLKKGADPDVRINGTTPIHTAVALNDIYTVRLLIKYNADINVKARASCGYLKSYHAITPLDIAIHNQNLPLKDLLIKHGAKASTKAEKIEAVLAHYRGDEGLTLMQKIMQLPE